MTAAARPRAAVFFGMKAMLDRGLPPGVGAGAPHFAADLGASLAMLAEAGFGLVVVSNQSGIARGAVSRAEFSRLQAGLQRQLLERAGVVLDDFLLCPHAPGPAGAPACLCRKPAPGLLTRAARMHGFELGRSWMIARSLDEVEAGHRAGCRSLLLGDDAAAGAGRRSPLRLPDALAQDWQAAVHLLRQPAAAGLQPGLACEAGAWAA